MPEAWNINDGYKEEKRNKEDQECQQESSLIWDNKPKWMKIDMNVIRPIGDFLAVIRWFDYNICQADVIHTEYANPLAIRKVVSFDRHNLHDDITLRSFDVGVDVHNFFPLSFNEVKEIMNKKKAPPPLKRRRSSSV